MEKSQMPRSGGCWWLVWWCGVWCLRHLGFHIVLGFGGALGNEGRESFFSCIAVHDLDIRFSAGCPTATCRGSQQALEECKPTHSEVFIVLDLDLEALLAYKCLGLSRRFSSGAFRRQPTTSNTWFSKQVGSIAGQERGTCLMLVGGGGYRWIFWTRKLNRIYLFQF